jgi:hypothetical protein
MCFKQCLYTLHTVSEFFYKYVICVMLIVIWLFPDIPSSLRIFKPCVGDKKSISFTEASEHSTFLIALSQCVWYSSVSVCFNFSHTLPIPNCDCDCFAFSVLFKNFFSYIVQFIIHFVIFILQSWHVHLHYKNIYWLCLDLRAMILS